MVIIRVVFTLTEVMDTSHNRFTYPLGGKIKEGVAVNVNEHQAVSYLLYRSAYESQHLIALLIVRARVWYATDANNFRCETNPLLNYKSGMM